MDVYSVQKMKTIKASHESLPEVVFDHDLLLSKVEEVLAQQIAFSKFMKKQSTTLHPGAYPIQTSWVHDAWTPEEGRFYESPLTDSGSFKIFAREGWLHVEQKLKDGAVAYYEINKQGSVRNSSFPYPINEYRVEIPESLVLSREHVYSTVGDSAVKTVLKWSAGTVTEHFVGGVFAGADCNARNIVDHVNRLIRILEPNNA